MNTNGGASPRGGSVERMDVNSALAFVATNHHAVMAVRRLDGTPTMSPVAVGVLDGTFVISSRETAYKVKSLRRDPHAWLCVLPDGFFGQWIQITADVEIISMPDALDPLIEYYRATVGEHPDWDDYAAAMEREQRVLLRLAPTAVGPTKQG
jgi:PPOX class probable F420-dependent enzyme